MTSSDPTAPPAAGLERISTSPTDDDVTASVSDVTPSESTPLSDMFTLPPVSAAMLLLTLHRRPALCTC